MGFYDNYIISLITISNSIYIIYFSQSPKKGSPTDVMIQAALEFGDLDEVRYLEFHETTN